MDSINKETIIGPALALRKLIRGWVPAVSEACQRAGPGGSVTLAAWPETAKPYRLADPPRQPHRHLLGFRACSAASRGCHQAADLENLIARKSKRRTSARGRRFGWCWSLR